jgi:hypothetical protein
MSLAGGQGPREVVQDLIRDLSVKRSYAGQYLRDFAHPDMGSHLQLGAQHRYPVTGVSFHRTAADPHRGRGLSLGQARVILQRDRLTRPVGQIAKHSRRGGPSQQRGSFTLAVRDIRRRRALSPICRDAAQLLLGQQPQKGLRALAIHTLSVLQLSRRRTGVPVSAWYPARRSPYHHSSHQVDNKVRPGPAHVARHASWMFSIGQG